MKAGLIALVLWLTAAVPLQAQAVRVTSGDHADFTRIVLEFPSPVDWRVGRTADGYELRLKGDPLLFDLSAVFQLIGRDRLAAIWADPDSDSLKFSVACACHAIPFEFRPGTVVIDLRNGPPPKGSSFEEPLDGGVAVAALADRPSPRPRPRPMPSNEAQADRALPFRWGNPGTDEPPPISAFLAALLDQNLRQPEASSPNLEPLRSTLIEQLGRGATQGIVEMAPPEGADLEGQVGGPNGAAPEGQAASVEIHLADAPNLDIRQKGEVPAPLSAEGVECLSDESLALSEWAAEDTPVAEQIGPALNGLTGEFDHPDPEAVSRAVRFYLSLGFGAEARSLLRAFPTEQADERVWISLARLVDGRPDPESAFSGMTACDTSAALWALLAEPEALALGQVEKAAVLRAFSALPIHLRREIGPLLVDRFLTMEDVATATALRDSVLRAGGERSVDVELMEASIEKAGGSPASSVARLEDLADEAGPDTPEALAALVIQRAELGQSVEFDKVQALESFTGEYEGTELGEKLSLALTLAHAASGDFASAFERLPETPRAEATLWQILAQSGRDSPLLERAVLPEGDVPPKAARASATLIAQRLVSLGLADQAARWLAMEPEPPPLLAAKVALGQGEAERALKLVEEMTSKPADELRLAAFRQLGDQQAIAVLSAKLGEEATHWAAVSRNRDWASLANEGPDAWREAARRALNAPGSDPDLPPPVGPLDQDHRLVTDSEATRAAISALLESVAVPAAMTN